MLTTIQELENEIEQFHKNIKDSNELMNILMSVVSLLKTQTNSFDVRASDLQNELTKLPPELSETFQEKIEIFIQQVQQEYQLYQNSIASLMDDYSDRVLETETAIKNIPVKLEEQLQNNNANTVKGLKQIQEQYADELKETNKSFSDKLQAVLGEIQVIPMQLKDDSAQQYKAFLNEVKNLIDVRIEQLSKIEDQVLTLSQELETKHNAFVSNITKIPTQLEEQLQENSVDNVKELKHVQEQYANELEETNKSFSEKLQAVLGEIQAIPIQWKDDSAQQYSDFLSEVKTLMDARMEQLSKTENHVLDLRQELETKYNAFITKLETTNMDQLYKYCQDMNKSINTKLGFILGGVGVAVVISIISLMF